MLRMSQEMIAKQERLIEILNNDVARRDRVIEECMSLIQDMQKAFKDLDTKRLTQLLVMPPPRIFL